MAEFNFMLIGAGSYRDRYRRTADGWRISATGYDRTYEATISLANLDFSWIPVTLWPELLCGGALGDCDDGARFEPLDDLHQRRVVDRHAALGGATVGGVEENAAPLPGSRFGLTPITTACLYCGISRFSLAPVSNGH